MSRSGASYLVAIVCDGMGGLAHGGEAARVACDRFIEACKSFPPAEPVPAMLHEAVHDANRAVVELAMQRQSAGNTGTTLVAVCLGPDGLHWVSAGDSSILLYRNHTMTQFNHSHTYASILDARCLLGEISRSAALEDRQREALTSFVGVPALREVDASVRPFPLAAGDVIVLASDGLSKTLEPEEIEAVLAETPVDPAQRLMETTIAKGRPHQDNVTVCVVSIGRQQAGSPQKGCLGMAVLTAAAASAAFAAGWAR